MSRPSHSVVFDRAIEYYDRSRAASPEAMSAMVEQLLPELPGGPCLEIGIGTGRIALPLHRAGADMMGIDLSLAMLAKLVENAGGDVPFPICAADAERLPFADSSLPCALACWVLHLIPDWRTVLGELVRVVVPGGRVLVEPGGWGHGWWKQITHAWCDAAGVEPRHPGATSGDEIDVAMRAAGARVRHLPTIVDHKQANLAATIDMLERGLFSFTWRVHASVRERAAAEVRVWARRAMGDLEKPRDLEWRFRWRSYDLA